MKIAFTFLLSAMSSIIFAQIPNADFEHWSGNNPVGWATFNVIYPGCVAPTNNAQHGDSAVELISTKDRFNNLYYGGAIQTTSLGTEGFFYNYGNPQALNGWYIVNSVAGDGLEISVLTKDTFNVDIGSAGGIYAKTTLVYKQFSACFNYFNSGIADSAEIIISLEPKTGDSTHAGSYAIVDDLSWGTCIAGVDDINNQVTLESAYPNPASQFANIIYAIPNTATVNVALYDLNGRKVMKILDNTNQTPGRYKIPVNVSKLANGVYAYTITVDGVPYTQKLVVAK